MQAWAQMHFHMCIYTTLAKPLSIVDLAAQLVDFASYTKQLEAKHITRANALCMGKGFSLDRDVTIGWQSSAYAMYNTPVMTKMTKTQSHVPASDMEEPPKSAVSMQQMLGTISFGKDTSSKSEPSLCLKPFCSMSTINLGKADGIQPCVFCLYRARRRERWRMAWQRPKPRQLAASDYSALVTWPKLM